MTDKTREEFEAAYRAACLNRPIPRFDPAVFVKDHCDDYLNLLVQSAWWAWQASRETLVIELPGVGPTPEPPEDAFDDSYLDAHHASIRMRNRCYLAIEAAGLKVTP